MDQHFEYWAAHERSQHEDPLLLTSTDLCEMDMVLHEPDTFGFDIQSSANAHCYPYDYQTSDYMTRGDPGLNSTDFSWSNSSYSTRDDPAMSTSACLPVPEDEMVVDWYYHAPALSSSLPSCEPWGSETSTCSTTTTTMLEATTLQMTTYTASSSGSGSVSNRANQTQTRTRPKRPKSFICLFPDCKTTRFGRAAELERHMKTVHEAARARAAANTSDEKTPTSTSTSTSTTLGCPSSFVKACDYRRCERANPGWEFRRHDHFRDHLREVHREDLPPRRRTSKVGPGAKSTTTTTTTRDWWESRVISDNWWRCSRCFERVQVRADGDAWVCPVCTAVCEAERQLERTGRTAIPR